MTKWDDLTQEQKDSGIFVKIEMPFEIDWEESRRKKEEDLRSLFRILRKNQKELNSHKNTATTEDSKEG